MLVISIVLIAFTSLAMLIALFSFFSKKEKPAKIQRDLKTLEKNIKDLKSQNLNDKDIEAKLSGAGWSEHVVHMALKDLIKPNHKLDKLQSFVNERIKKGDLKEDLKETLMEAGWSEDIIDLVLKL